MTDSFFEAGSFFEGLDAEDVNTLLNGGKSHPGEKPATGQQPGSLPHPDHSQLETFVQTLFKHATPGNWASLRVFRDESEGPPFKITSVKLNGDLGILADRAFDDAKLAALSPEKLVFCPPVATFTNKKTAKEKDLAEGLALSTECDANAEAARVKLEQLLGPATLVVASGGQWTNPKTGEVEPKLHVHYRLKAPAGSKDDRQKLKLARQLATAIVGGDPSNVSIVHPIRWPGSLHRKGDPKLCSIVSVTDNEIDLGNALETLQKAAGNGEAPGVVRIKSEGERLHFNGQTIAPAFAHLPLKSLAGGIKIEIEAPIERIRAAFAVIPNDDSCWKDKGERWYYWNTRGMALFRATGGSNEGLAVFQEWSKKLEEKYDEQKTADRWAAYHTCQPTEIGAGSIFFWANEVSPNWDLGLRQEPPEPAWANLGEGFDGPPSADPSFVDIYAEFAGPPFPLDALPPTLAAFIDAQHRNTGADPSALAMAALASVAGATHAETMALAGEGWWERPILWVFLIGLPSMKKTPTIKKAMKPLVLIDHERRTTRQQEYATWKQAQQGERKGKTPPPSRRPRCIIRDITPEKVAEILSREPCGSMLVRDELAGWIANFERYNSDARSFYLETFDGGTSGKDRVGRGAHDEEAEIHIENLALCVLGGIQPDKLIALGDLTSDGLLQRGLPCLMRAAERGDQYYSVTAAETAYDKLLRAINKAPPNNYLFDKDALEVRDRVNDKLFELEQLDGFSEALIGAIGKLSGYFTRICLVLEVARLHDPMRAKAAIKADADAEKTRETGFLLKAMQADAEALDNADSERLHELFGVHADKSLAAGINSSKRISRETAEAAEKILDQFLKPHIFGLYDVIVNGGQDRSMLRGIGDFILASTKDRLRPSDLTTGVRSLRGQPEHKIREWAGRFDAMGWLQGEEVKPGIPPKAWKVVPGLREHFAERRRQAEAARAAAHTILKAGGK